ncbi:MAG: hypothetical protein H6836_09845 [Planctomycetes bacterium]|nr:hypothetical protein [Planctomycetota bacterium]
MTRSEPRPIDVLTLLGERQPMEGLLRELHNQGIRVDVAHSLGDARTLFFGAGGHDCLVVAPDVGPGLASRVLNSLRTVDPELPTASFGPALRGQEAPTRTAHLAAFHPGSRAGAGALLRFLRNLQQRGAD